MRKRRKDWIDSEKVYGRAYVQIIKEELEWFMMIGTLKGKGLINV